MALSKQLFIIIGIDGIMCTTNLLNLCDLSPSRGLCMPVIHLVAMISLQRRQLLMESKCGILGPIGKILHFLWFYMYVCQSPSYSPRFVFKTKRIIFTDLHLPFSKTCLPFSDSHLLFPEIHKP